LAAIEEAIFLGVAVNVTLLFSAAQYIAAVEAYRRSIERRIGAGLGPKVGSVASLFISRWDVSVNQAVSQKLRNQLGIAIARRVYREYRELLNSPRWQKLCAAGAQPQRLLWASTGSKDKQISESYYVTALAAPNTINTIPEPTLLAFAKRGELVGVMPVDGGDAEIVLAAFAQAGVDVDALAARLQQEGAAAFSKSWDDLLEVISAKSRQM
jgi:transaldolase